MQVLKALRRDLSSRESGLDVFGNISLQNFAVSIRYLKMIVGMGNGPPYNWVTIFMIWLYLHQSSRQSASKQVPHLKMF